MARLNQNITSREFRRILLNNGFDYISTNGSHSKYRRDGHIVVVNKNLNAVVAQRLIKENNLVL